MNKTFIIILLLFSAIGFAQNKGTITGIVLDKEVDNTPLPFANVFIKGTTIGTTTEFEGNYSFQVSPGTYTLVFSFIGYQTIEVPNVIVSSGKTTTVNKTLSASEGVSLSEIQITASNNKESETALLTEQRKAIAIEQKIGAQELARKGVSDVASALTKTTGISKEEGSGGVFVRGLGDRYNVTTLNGLPLPSNNPSKKNIDLDIFSTDIVEYIGIDKTYNVRNYGDFAGANVNIASKNYKGNGFVEMGIETGVNTHTVSVGNFYLNDGPNLSGFYTNNYPDFPLNNYNFTTSWDREKVSTPINGGASLKGGDSYSLGEETKLNFFTVASFNNDYTYKEGVARGGVTSSGLPRKDLEFTGYSYSTNTTLMGNMGVSRKGQTIKYNGLFVNSTSQEQEEYVGTIDVYDNASEGGGFLQRAIFEKTQLIVHQLLGDHKMSDSFDINWGASYNFVLNSVPDRRQITLTPDNWSEPEGPKSFKQSNNASDNHRLYQDLEDEEIAANFSGTFKFNKNEFDEFVGKLTIGYSGRFKTVDFKATQFNFRINKKATQPIIEDIYDLDSYFNQANLNANLYSIETFRGNLNQPKALDPQTFGGSQKIHAGFVSFEYAFNPKFTVIVGLRGEQINQTIDWNTSLSSGTSELDELEILPMISMKYELNDTQNLKFAASKTYTLPQYKERALFQFVGATQSSVGNPSLYASADYNADIKWELFPKSNEIISIGVFGKYIQNPINDVTINSASNDISYVNSGDLATAFGAELEIRKNIFERESRESYLKNNLSFGFNASYMNSSQDLDKEKVITETTAAGYPISVDFTNTKDGLSGASDLLLNADVSYYKEYKKDKSIQATLAYNYFSDRIFAIGTENKGDLIDKGVGTLDFVFKTMLNKNLGLGLSVKNLLEPTIERIQEVQNVTVSSYKTGINAKLSISYNF